MSGTPPNPSIPLEVVAAITAAISAVLGHGEFAITGIQPATVPAAAQGAPSAWARVGVLESHLSRRSFGLRTR